MFLLSEGEAKKYFSSNNARQAVATAFAVEKGAYVSDNYRTASGEATLYWWLRTPGLYSDGAYNVYNDGSVCESYLSDVNYPSFGVRPALWVNLES